MADQITAPQPSRADALVANAKARAKARIGATRDQLIDLSRRIHAHPELGWEEHQASSWLTAVLGESGFAVERGACGLPTAFVARAGSGPLHVGICAEYDALPGIGHACGHNLIAASSLGAAIGTAAIADDVGLTVTVLGTPAEEKGDAGGKILMLERGAFAGIHAAMMVHPAPIDVVEPPIIAAGQFDVRYTGKAAHASASPEQGINAADALVIAHTAIGLLRQQLRPTDRVHGIVTRGGDVPNVIPAHTEASYFVRASTLDEVNELRTRVLRCFEAGALATGATLEVIGGTKPYAELHHDHAIAALYRANAEALGRKFPDLPIELLRKFAGSTDMGNVSRVIPAIHPFISIGSWPATNHQPEFTACCVTPAAEQAFIDAAIAMSWTAVDVACDQAVRASLLGAKPLRAATRH
jgi:amidohydrolase